MEKVERPEKNENKNQNIATTENSEIINTAKNHGNKLNLDKVNELSSLIKKQKKGFLGGNHRDNIIDLTTELCETKKHAELLLQHYEKNFNKNLINELKSISSSYDGIKSYVYPFIQLEIIDEEFPHERVNK